MEQDSSFFIAGLLFADNIVNLFGDFESEIHDLAVLGVRVFFSGYLFMGFNFVMMTYFQTTDRIGMATFITVARELILMVIFLLVLPPLLGATGVFIAIPISEFIVATSIFIYAYKKHVFQN